MEQVTGKKGGYEDEQQLELPPGFRFYPSDEELVSHYLAPKVFDSSFRCLAIGEADLNKCEPWDLPWRAKMAGDKEWYFFSLKDRKYPTGLRTNRATRSGYWKATGKDKEIYKMKTLVGMKKTLVFYKGRAPKGDKTNWVMHEFRLQGKCYLLPKKNNEWVISRVFEKCSGGKKTHITSLGPSSLPPLVDSSPRRSGTEGDGTCFSNPAQSQLAKEEEVAVDSYLSNSFIPSSSKRSSTIPSVSQLATHPQQASSAINDLRNILLLESNKNWTVKTEHQHPTGLPSYMSNSQPPKASPNGGTFHHMSVVSQDDHSAAGGLSDLDSIWNYFMQ